MGRKAIEGKGVGRLGSIVTRIIDNEINRLDVAINNIM
jgi:hypothetical protein